MLKTIREGFEAVHPRARLIAAAAVVAAAGIAAAVILTGTGDEPGPIVSGTSTPSPAPAPTATAPAATPTPTPTPAPPPADHVQAVVSSHHLATDAAFEVLEAGGTAADAAIAVAAALSVVEPWFSSVLGGGTWALYYEAETGDVTSLDGVGPTGSNATVADFAARGSASGMHQANVPGAWDGWMLWLDRYGSLDLGDVLGPAIRIAREGYPVYGAMAEWLGRQADLIPNRPDTARIYMPDGVLVQQGQTVFQHDLAATFEALAAAYDAALPDGRTQAVQAARDYYYRGPLAEAIVAFSDAGGGYLTLQDFHNFEARIVEPVSIDYNGITVYENPPNSQGITMLIALNILKGFDFSALSVDSPDAVHLQVEALKLAFSDRYYHVGDPDRVSVPVDRLLSDEHAASQRGRIDMANAMQWPVSDGLSQTAADAGDTTTFHITDRYGNAAAVTTSLGTQFMVVGDTGIHINNRMRFLSTADGDPNQLAPGYKVRHTSNPYIALRDGIPYILGGNTGADTQVQGQVQQFIRVVEFGLSAQDAVGLPRILTTSFPSTIFPYPVANTLQVEPGTPSALVDALQARGQNTVVGPATWGTANMIVLAPDGRSASVGADPRSNVTAGRAVPPP